MQCILISRRQKLNVYIHNAIFDNCTDFLFWVITFREKKNKYKVKTI